MNQFDHKTVNARGYAEIDQGLRSYMIQVYNFMSLALLMTGLVAYAAASPTMLGPWVMPIIFGPSPLKWVIMLAPLGMVLYLGSQINRISYKTAQLLFWGYAALLGLSISSIFLVYTFQSVAKVFFITASVFGSMSLYGYTTQKDLTSMGSFMVMGLLGVIIASLVNLFFQSSALNFLLSILSVVIFTGLTAYDTQMIKSMYYQLDDGETLGKKALMGALNLYLDFINLFLSLLRLFGDRR